MRLPLIMLAAVLPVAASAQVYGSSEPVPQIRLYASPLYFGRSITVTGAVPNLAAQTFSARAQSVRVVGEWEVCTGVNYTGTCRRLVADQPVLARATIVSLRPIMAMAPAGTPAATTTTSATATVDLDALDVDAGVEGQDVAFFARPSLSGSQISAGSNDRTAGDAFCRQAGYASSLHASRARVQTSNLIDVTARTRVRAFALRDVLCRR